MHKESLARGCDKRRERKVDNLGQDGDSVGFKALSELGSILFSPKFERKSGKNQASRMSFG